MCSDLRRLAISFSRGDTHSHTHSHSHLSGHKREANQSGSDHFRRCNFKSTRPKRLFCCFVGFLLAEQHATNDARLFFLQHKLMRLIKCLIEHFKRLISNSIWVPSSNNKAKQKNPNKHTKKERYRHANLYPCLEHHLAGVYPPVFLRWGHCHRSLTLVKQTEAQTLLFVISALTH